MARKETCILTNMCMVYDGDRVLVQDRLDPQWPGITFPGGHVEPGESFVESAIREVREETGLEISDVRLCGVKQWTQRDGEFRYIVFFFKTDRFSGTLRDSEEGKVFWIDKKELSNYVLADGFDRMYPVFDDDHLSENYFWFADDQWNAKNI
jgi:8-oxo-dGTP diphosphatase